MPDSNGHCGNSANRRRFLRDTTLGVAGAAVVGNVAFAAQEAGEGPPLVTLGKTGQKVSKLGMGTSWSIAPSFVQAALAAGVRYIDTSETYENTLVEKTLGQVLGHTGMRKEVYLVTKTAGFRRGQGDSFRKDLEAHLEASLDRLQTDYVDAYYLHGIEGRHLGLLRDPAVKAAFEGLKKSKKIRYCGFSCHDGQLPELLEAGAECGWLDQVMFKFNFRDIGGRDRGDDLNRAIDRAVKANLGLVAMKTQGGAGNFPEKMAELQRKGFKKEVAAIKTVWMDGRIQVAVSEMTTRTDLRENVSASRDALSPREAMLLEEHRLRTAGLYCHGCGHLCETAARGVPVATVLRYLRYYSVYGKRQEARALYQALPEQARDLGAADLRAADQACPHGLPVGRLMAEAKQRLG